MAVLAGGQGLLAQKSINFTRHDEIEADRVGIQTLANAGFDPNAMASFFERMEDVMSADAGGIEVPSLLQEPSGDHRAHQRRQGARRRVDRRAESCAPSGTTLDKSQWEKSTAPMPFVKDPSVLDRPATTHRQVAWIPGR
jgi:predicted Zn-dependent protease